MGVDLRNYIFAGLEFPLGPQILLDPLEFPGDDTHRDTELRI